MDKTQGSSLKLRPASDTDSGSDDEDEKEKEKRIYPLRKKARK